MRERILFVLALVLLSIVSISAAPGDLDTSFTSFLTNKSNVFSVNHIQVDGKILVAGSFDTANDKVRPSIARFLADGTLDPSFYSPLTISVGNTDPSAIQIIKTQSNGKILIGGVFHLNNISTRTYGLLRLNPDGSLDTIFNSLPSVTSLQNVYHIEITSDDKIVILVASNLTEILSADGTLEAQTSNGISYSALQSDNKIIGVVSPNTLRRFNQDLTIDSSFQSSTVSGITNSAIQLDGKVILVGFFTSLQGFAISGIARFNADGSLDTTFNTNPSIAPNSNIRKVIIQPDGKIIIGGDFTMLGSTPANRVARININGTVDTTFNAPANLSGSTVIDLDTQADGRVLVNAYNDVFRLNADGSLDTSYASPRTTSNTPFGKKILVQPDNKILAVYGFNTANEKTAIGLVRFNANGSVDQSFNPVPVNPTTPFGYALALQPDGKILVPSSIGTDVVRLNSDGSLDITFPNSPGANSIVVAPDNKIYLGKAGQQSFLRRYNANGTLDTTFTSVLAGGVIDLAVQPDGKLLVANDNPQGRRIYRLNPDGNNDATFAPNGGATGNVSKIVFQPDGKIILGGSFTSLNQDNNRKYLARLNADGSTDTTFSSTINQIIFDLKLQTNGRILVAVQNSLANSYKSSFSILRLNSDGTPDSTFNSNEFIGGINSIDVQSGNRVIVAGTFNVVSGVPQIGIARLIGDSTGARTPFDFDGDGRADVSVFRPSNGVWYLNQSTNGFTGAAFGQAGDKLVPADYDGDGKTDLAVVRNGVWYIQQSSLGFYGVQFGNVDDIPVPADYDGDGKTDIAVFRPSNGTWYLQQSTNGFAAIALGLGTDKPVPGDYNGDGKAEVAVFRPSNGTWYLSTNPATGYGGVVFGAATDILVPADYDGDGKTDLAVFRPSNGTWYIQRSSAGFIGIAFGLGTDLPVPADYDGDGKADIAVVRNGNWYLNRSTAGFTGITFGFSDDKPIPNSFVR